jgi:hypothetical protein
VGAVLRGVFVCLGVIAVVFLGGISVVFLGGLREYCRMEVPPQTPAGGFGGLPLGLRPGYALSLRLTPRESSASRPCEPTGLATGMPDWVGVFWVLGIGARVVPKEKNNIFALQGCYKAIKKRFFHESCFGCYCFYVGMWAKKPNRTKI